MHLFWLTIKGNNEGREAIRIFNVGNIISLAVVLSFEVDMYENYFKKLCAHLYPRLMHTSDALWGACDCSNSDPVSYDTRFPVYLMSTCSY